VATKVGLYLKRTESARCLVQGTCRIATYALPGAQAQKKKECCKRQWRRLQSSDKQQRWACWESTFVFEKFLTLELTARSAALSLVKA
jgi:hypothetical protein